MSESLAMMLRRLGETADGSRDEGPKLVSRDEAGTLVLEVVTTAKFLNDSKPGGEHKYTEILGDGVSSSKVPFAPFDEIVFRKAGADIACVRAPTDSLFWTDSAFEKFVYGYYEQLRIFPEDYLANLKRDLRDPERRPLIIAVKHDSPSHSEPLARSPTCPEPPPDSPDGLFYCSPRLAQFNGGYPWVTPEQFRSIFLANRASLLDPD